MFEVPFSLAILCILAVLWAASLAIYSLFRSNPIKRHRAAEIALGMTIFSMLWLTAVAWLSSAGRLSPTGDSSITPGIFYAMLLPLLSCSLLFLPSVRRHLESIPLALLYLIHLTRIPLEYLHTQLFAEDLSPEALTIHGNNFDVLVGFSAIAMFIYTRKNGNEKTNVVHFGWNLLGLAISLNLLISILFSIPSAYQNVGFEQPNFISTMFPFSWIPTCLIPIHITAHLSVLVRGLKPKKAFEHHHDPEEAVF
jgi:hypothetical protein